MTARVKWVGLGVMTGYVDIRWDTVYATLNYHVVS